MNTLATRSLPRTGHALTALGLGGAPRGKLYGVISEAHARATVDAAWAAGIRCFDTAPLRRVVPPGETGWRQPLPFEVVHDHSAGAIRCSVEDCLQRLGTNHIDLALGAVPAGASGRRVGGARRPKCGRTARHRAVDAPPHSARAVAGLARAGPGSRRRASARWMMPAQENTP